MRALQAKMLQLKTVKRDAMKDESLRRYGFPILRLRTDGSNERARLIDALETVTTGAAGGS